ncbi:hypothetical protein HHI36_023537 [Cryptolaemus montrouzieri]|uniref:Uncharacterized protein n=1 Tax=Cryptolaemus montrouzieri TaxID=559131 RepID=A0ABD2PGR6_9CUCU
MDTNYDTLLSKLESLERENRALKDELKVVVQAKLRIDHDISSVVEVLSSASIIHSDIARVVRLEKRGPKNRPTKVILTCRDHVMKVLKNSFNIKNAFKDKTISISDDRTDLERTFLNEIQDQLQERRQADEKNFIIRYTKGIPGIVKSVPKS